MAARHTAPLKWETGLLRRFSSVLCSVNKILSRATKKNAKNFGILKIVLIFAVQYRGVEQLVARRAHNPEAGGSSPSPATRKRSLSGCAFLMKVYCVAGVLKLVDKPDLGSGAARRMGSIPFARTLKG